MTPERKSQLYNQWLRWDAPLTWSDMGEIWEGFTTAEAERDALLRYAQEARVVILDLMFGYKLMIPGGEHTLRDNNYWTAAEALLARLLPGAQKEKV